MARKKRLTKGEKRTSSSALTRSTQSSKILVGLASLHSSLPNAYATSANNPAPPNTTKKLPPCVATTPTFCAVPSCFHLRDAASTFSARIWSGVLRGNAPTLEGSLGKGPLAALPVPLGMVEPSASIWERYGWGFAGGGGGGGAVDARRGVRIDEGKGEGWEERRVVRRAAVSGRCILEWSRGLSGVSSRWQR